MITDHHRNIEHKNIVIYIFLYSYFYTKLIQIHVINYINLNKDQTNETNKQQTVCERFVCVHACSLFLYC